MNTADFDIKVPPEQVAQEPVNPRDHSKLLVLDKQTGDILHCHFYDLPFLLSSGDCLVFNNTRVIPARLKGSRVDSPMEGVIVLLLRQIESTLNTWESLVEVGSVEQGEKITLGNRGLIATVIQIKETIGRHGETIVILALSDETLIEQSGELPIPPYVHGFKGDPERYQTIYSSIRGSSAAPTAGLHFTNTLLDKLSEKGIKMAFVTLHVGIDTFMPIYESSPEEHKMYTEYCEVKKSTADFINKVRALGKRVITVGTTSTRTLETATSTEGLTKEYGDWTSIYITPGYKWRGISGLITNFHYPRSTNLVMVSALAGLDKIQKAYKSAIENNYRFYSFGDSMFIV